MLSTRRALSVCLLALVCASAVSAVEEETRLLRFADIHDERVAFVYAGDLWTAPVTGGDATRLTTDVGLELFPKFSPDGRFIAYSAEYSGSRQVWVVPAEGGTPRQLTFRNDVGSMPPRGGFDYQVMDWTPDGEHVLFRANRLPWSERMGRPYLVPLAGGDERPLEIPESGGGTLSPDGTRLAYTPIDREFRTWKRHQGGRAQDVWIYDLAAHTSERITDWKGTDNQPVWFGETIYFTSDRDGGRLNLWAYDLRSGQTTRVTDHRDFDVLWPSGGPGGIVYECGGRLHHFDPRSGSSRPISIRVGGDFPNKLPRFENVAGLIGSGAISPSGKRAVFSARGDIFSVPAEHGVTQNLTRTPGTRELGASWSPDGRHVAYLSDRSGEYEIYVRAADGSGDERRVTSGGGVWRFAPVWSPDGKRFALGDSRQTLSVVEVQSGAVVTVDRGTHNNITTYRWSPDSRWLVYDKLGESGFASIYVWSVEGRSPLRLTDGLTNDYEASFDPEGVYLYFLSDRDFNLTFSGYEFNYFYTNPTRVYAATLRADGPALLVPKNDEESTAPGEAPSDDGDEKKDKNGKKAAKADAAAVVKPVQIDVEGFAARVMALPGPSDAYRDVTAIKGGVLFVQGQGGETALKRFNVADEKVETIVEAVSSYDVSRDGKKLLYARGETFGIVEIKPGQKVGDGKLDLSGMNARIEPEAEWRQIFADAWRITRDWFYDEGMHGLDWMAMRELYEPLVAHIAHRADLDYILGEMGGELSAGHFYVNWGDMPRPKRIDGGLLGAEFERHESGYYRVERIFPGENWHLDFRSPLTMPGVDVEEGDFILAVNGRSTRDVENFYRLLEHQAGKQVVLRINERPDESGARDQRVVAIAAESELRYLDWVSSRRAMVDELSGGRIGYVHLPNTAADGNRELSKYFYPQAHKDALIIDVRYNGGGFIPDRMIELVSRPQLSLWARRGVAPTRTPGFAHAGPKACLINGYSSSGGDAFPYYFRKLGLGPLIGTRTWGGLIGISGNPGFLDGGSVNIPTFRILDTDGNWVVENVGVAPDIEVLDLPERVARGEDPTLQKAVEVLLDELRRNPPQPVEVPEPPRMPR